MSSSRLIMRMVELIAAGAPFTADDLTFDGSETVDAAHGPNAGQNAIGQMFRAAGRDGHIVWTGEVRRSRAPHRKGGAQRVWEPTPAGKAWARRQMEAQ